MQVNGYNIHGKLKQCPYNVHVNWFGNHLQ